MKESMNECISNWERFFNKWTNGHEQYNLRNFQLIKSEKAYCFFLQNFVVI